MGFFFNRNKAAAQKAAAQKSTPADAAAGATRDATNLKRVRIRFGGVCQGVGFRYTASDIATTLDLTGWVKNEPDGTVLAELQGRPDCVNVFVTRMQNAYRRLPTIRFYAEEIDELPPDADETSFRVRT